MKFRPKQPFNLELLILTSNMVNLLGEVKSKDVYEQNSTVFKEDGLFSTKIFGEVGTEERMTRYGYINLNLHVFHPLIYRYLTKLNSLYKKIINGTAYVIFDEKEKDFVEVNPTDGHTGFKYFIKYYDKIQFKRTDSDQRDNIIKFLKKYKAKDIIVNKWLVIPAGLRDYVVTPSGKVMESEINNLYRKVLTVANTAKLFKEENNDDYTNKVRVRLQKSINDVYEYIENILEGKEGFIQGKWVKRRLLYGSRNVLTALPIEMSSIDDPQAPRYNDIVIGLFQYIKNILPITIFKVRTKFLDRYFSTNTTTTYLINKTTLKRELVELSEKSRSNWITDEGLENTINKLTQDVIKDSPVVIDGHYLLLVYDTGNEIRIIESIDDVMQNNDVDKNKIRPITYGELFYLAIEDTIGKYKGYATRYPIANYGNVYPGNIYVKTTVKGRVVKYSGIGTMEPKEIKEYPILGMKWFNSMSVHPTHLGRLGGDYDGKEIYQLKK